MTETPTAQLSLAALVDGYSRRVCEAVLEQHPDSSVSSPLGIWLLLAACSTAATGQDLKQLEEVLGCSASDAALLLAEFLEAPPQALHSAIALWVRGSDHTSRLVDWSAGLPRQVERGPIPTQAVADAWADRNTMGLIKKFPIEITERTRLVLASALATKVTWQQAFEVVPADEHFRPSSPWAGRVRGALLDRTPVLPVRLAKTDAAGVVAVHFALANEELAVLSVAADGSLDRHLVLEAAYELARRCREDALEEATCSLFDLPVGAGHSWEITEEEVPAQRAGERSELIDYTVLPAWSLSGDLDLKRSNRFGTSPALSALLGLIGPHPAGDKTDAMQSAIASYTPTGFEAAAVTSFAIAAAALHRQPQERGTRRRARILFDHPYASVALAGATADFKRARAGHAEMFGLPLFSVWVAEPGEPEVVGG
ncbi:MAG TPA: serpin family protein [Acidimicrobiales bacterium]|jgi:hypothetical protein|nr:serpin family protein [Acidimicrobiales bacterium]